MDLPEVYDTLPAFDLDADLPLDPPEHGLVAIYALTDPRDGAIRYIGKSIDVRLRVKQHCTPWWQRQNTPKQRWLHSLMAAGQQPHIRVLAWVQAHGWAGAERHAIAQARLAGCDLTNSTAGGDGSAERIVHRTEPYHGISRADLRAKQSAAQQERRAHERSTEEGRAHLSAVLHKSWETRRSRAKAKATGDSP